MASARPSRVRRPVVRYGIDESDSDDTIEVRDENDTSDDSSVDSDSSTESEIDVTSSTWTTVI